MAITSFDSINDVNKKNSKEFDKLLNFKCTKRFKKIKLNKATPSRILAIRKSMNER